MISPPNKQEKNMAELERYLDVDGKYAWRVKKKVNDIVEKVPQDELPEEVAEAEAPKPKRRRRG